VSQAVMLQGVLVDGPCDGALVSVREGFDFVKVTVVRRAIEPPIGVWLYEFDPVTAKDGRWIYRCRRELHAPLLTEHIAIWHVVEEGGATP